MKIDFVKQMSIILCFSIAVFSCSKNKDKAPPTEDELSIELAKQKAITDVLYEDVSMEVAQINIENGLTNQPESPQQTCATITVTPSDLSIWPKTVVIDYGSAGCTGSNGFLRKGKIIYTLTDKLMSKSAVLKVGFENYSVNGYKLEGDYVITNNGSDNGLNISVQLTNGKVTYPNGNTYTKTINSLWVQSAGIGTITNKDDEYNVTGTGTLTTSDNKVLTAATKTNLLRKVSCYYTVSGIMDLTYNGISGTINYGNGDCDKNTVLTFAGKEYAFTLP